MLRREMLVIAVILAILYAVVTLGAGMNIAFQPENHLEISLNPSMLPYYSGRSLLRMFAAFAASLLFTLLYGYIAANHKTARNFMLPLLDILQSVPVLGFLSVTITAFMELFPDSLLGIEAAAIFAIFTGQAWNMTFSFYHSLITIPTDLKEAAAILKMNWWQRLTRLEVPFAMMALVWNSMMSFGGGWFFLAASEAISVLGSKIRLPGIGSYMAVAVETGDMEAIIYSLITMVVMIIVVDQLFWRPTVVWAQKFKVEMAQASDAPTSFVYDILRRSVTINQVKKYVFAPMMKCVDAVMNYTAVQTLYFKKKQLQSGVFTKSFSIIKIIVFLYIGIQAVKWIKGAFIMAAGVSGAYVLSIIFYGMLTFLRVMAALVIGMLWTVPVGVWIGSNPRLSKIMQPIVQILASFPANMLFPFIAVLYLNFNVNFEWGAVPLMLLGTQWYLLFNIIAGAMSIPTELIEVGRVFKLKGWQKWRKLILPAIFPYVITGAVAASGGAWNASIIAEVVNWKGHELVASGLGAFISQVTQKGDWTGIILGISVMCLFVVAVNRLVWSKLIRLTQVKFHLD